LVIILWEVQSTACALRGFGKHNERSPMIALEGTDM
jgi:hypothetical protein